MGTTLILDVVLELNLAYKDQYLPLVTELMESLTEEECCYETDAETKAECLHIYMVVNPQCGNLCNIEDLISKLGKYCSRVAKVKTIYECSEFDN